MNTELFECNEHKTNKCNKCGNFVDDYVSWCDKCWDIDNPVGID